MSIPMHTSIDSWSMQVDNVLKAVSQKFHLIKQMKTVVYSSEDNLGTVVE